MGACATKSCVLRICSLGARSFLRILGQESHSRFRPMGMCCTRSMPIFTRLSITRVSR